MPWSLNIRILPEEAEEPGHVREIALQNSDVLLSIGNRQGFAQTGFQYQDWARGSYTILNDIDENDIKQKVIPCQSASLW